MGVLRREQLPLVRGGLEICMNKVSSVLGLARGWGEEVHITHR